MKASPFTFVLALVIIAIIGYMAYMRIKANMALYGDDFWPMVWCGGVIFGIVIIWGINEIRKNK